MSTRSNFPIEEIGQKNPLVFSKIRTTIESAFYGNNVIEVKTMEQAYELAKNCKGTVVSDLPVAHAKELGLPADAKVLIFNDGAITGRQARLRKLINKDNTEHFASVLREVMFNDCRKTMYHAQVYVGLDKDFMCKAHLLIPEGFENNLYSWLMNFQIVNDEYTKVYKESKKLEDGDIFIFSDPGYVAPEYPEGLAMFDADHNCACLLGMRYFGEHKKGTLTLAWSLAARHGYTACHGGQKRFELGERSKVISVFGLSGSGKSTITLSDHGGKYHTTVLHDDAFIISNDDGSSVCLEQSYFDKTQDYPLTNPHSEYFVTIQNVGVTRDEKGRIVPVNEDVRNGNGRTVKSKFDTPNRQYKFDQKTNAIFWIMKDPTLPPVVKVNSPALASVMGATLATKRSTAEFTKGEDLDKLVIVPYANPFRLYELAKDYDKFKSLFEMGIDCYIINTGFFGEAKVTPKVTLGLIEDIVEERAKFEKFGSFSELEYMPIKGFIPDFKNKEYVANVKARMQDRLENVTHPASDLEKLPEEAIAALQKVVNEAK